MSKIFRFYVEGFRSMTLGRKLWAIIIIKVLVLVLMKFIFFPDLLSRNFPADKEKKTHVIGNLTNHM